MSESTEKTREANRIAIMPLWAVLSSFDNVGAEMPRGEDLDFPVRLRTCFGNLPRLTISTIVFRVMQCEGVKSVELFWHEPGRGDAVFLISFDSVDSRVLRRVLKVYEDAIPLRHESVLKWIANDTDRLSLGATQEA